MMIDRGPKVDTKMYEANIKLQNENKSLKYDNDVLNKKIKEIKEFCKNIDGCYPEYKPFASRIIFMIESKEEEKWD